jgi:putative ABC transport system permease protein
MRHLFRLITFRMLRLDPLQSFLTLLGVALGVAVFVAILITNRSILKTYRHSVELLTGRADLSVSAEGFGLDEALIRTIRETEGVASTSPVIETVAAVKEGPARGEVLLVLGVDLLAEEPFRRYELSSEAPEADLFTILTRPDALLITERFAERHRLTVGDSLPLAVDNRVIRFIILGLLRPVGPAQANEGNIALVDIAAAQWTFGKLGQLDRVDLATSEGLPSEAVAARLSERLPSSVSVDRPETKTRQAERMLSAFQLNLTALSAISLFVSLFLVYNTLSFTLVRRRREIGLLRAVGAGENDLFRLFLLEGLLFGLLGGAVGVLMGDLFARFSLNTVSTTVTSLYLWVPREEIVLDRPVILAGIGIGTVISLIASFFPTLSASRVPPREAIDGAPPLLSAPSRWLSPAGLLLLAASYPLSLLPSWRGLPLTGYLAAFSLFLGFALITPLFLIGTGRLLSRLLRQQTFPEARLALNRLLQSPTRTGATVAALMVSMAMLIGVVILIGSFRRTVNLWIDQTLTADLVGLPASALFNGANGTFPEAVLSKIEGTEGVAAVDGYRSIPLRYRGEQIVLAGRDLGIHERFSRFLYLSKTADHPVTLARRTGGALITEGMADRFSLKVGDLLSLPSPSGPVSLPITGVFYDYSTEGGKVVIDRGLFKARWKDDRVSVAVIYFKKGADVEEARKQMVAALGATDGIAFITHAVFKAEVLRIFDQTFAITYALEGVAVLVALLGIVNALLVSILERRREIGVIQAIGASRGQLLKMTLYEAGYIGVAGYALGLLCGIFLSMILIFVINKQSFGWTVFFTFPYRLIPEALILILFTSLAASILPARKLLRIPIAEAVMYE